MNSSVSERQAFQSFKCPECGAAIQVSEAIAARVAEAARIELHDREAQLHQHLADLEREMTDRRASLDEEVCERVEAALFGQAADAEHKARSLVALEVADLKKQVSEKNEQVEAARGV